MEKQVGTKVQRVQGFTVYYNVWCILGHGNAITVYKLNDQPVREQVTASNYYNYVTTYYTFWGIFLVARKFPYINEFITQGSRKMNADQDADCSQAPYL